VANVFKPMMARGELNLIGATTLNEYQKYIEKAMIASSEMLTLWCASKVSRRPRRIMMVWATVGSGTVTGPGRWRRRAGRGQRVQTDDGAR
jgi:hypothetical protein